MQVVVPGGGAGVGGVMCRWGMPSALATAWGTHSWYRRAHAWSLLPFTLLLVCIGFGLVWAGIYNPPVPSFHAVHVAHGSGAVPAARVQQGAGGADRRGACVCMCVRACAGLGQGRVCAGAPA